MVVGIPGKSAMRFEKSISAHMRDQREDADLTQPEAAELLDMSLDTYGRIERGKRDFRYKELRRAVRVFPGLRSKIDF